MELSIILPTYNEKENINILVNQILSILRNIKKKEIIIIDDNSPDKTYENCFQAFNKYKNIKIILRKKNPGLANSIWRGIKVAKGKYLIVMDTDFTHNPKLILKLFFLKDQYDIISCSRFCAGGNMHNRYHYYASFIFNLIIRIILNTQIQDNLGGYYCFKRKKLINLPYKKIFYGYGDYFYRLLFFSQKKNYSIIELPAFYDSRKKGKSKSNFLKLLFKYLFDVIKFRLLN